MPTLSHCHPDAKHRPGECNLCDYYETRSQNKTLMFPHCDGYVLHRPKDCEICDKYASEMQDWRQKNGVNFTGEDDPKKITCPATARRQANTIHKWHGNSPRPKSCPKCGVKAVYINLALACHQHGPI